MAVELLIRLHDGPGKRRKGDIVSAKALPHRGWGKGEGLPNYTIIRIEDKGLKDIESFTIRHKPILFDAKGQVIESMRSTYGVNIDALPSVDRIAAITLGKVYSDWTTINTRLINYVALDALGGK